MRRSYCKLFVNGKLDAQALFQDISLHAGRTVAAGFPDLDTKMLGISLKANSDYPATELPAAADEFLYFPFYLEIDHVEGKEFDEMSPTEGLAYQDEIRALLAFLKARSWQVVPACDFEDYLNGPEPER